jgi:2'-5' RNA ligase
MKTIRAFIAIPLPAEVKSVLAEVIQGLAVQVPDRSVRWVKPQLMHITLRFLGDTAEPILPSLADMLDNIASQQSVFKLRVDKLGCFPNDKRPRVIWVGLSGQLDAACALKQDIDKSLLPLGWEHEKRSFSPHLTLGRVKDSRKLRGIQWQADVEQVIVPVRTIQLIESELHSTGPIYTVRHKSILRD